MGKFNKITICGNNNNYVFRLPERIEIPDEIWELKDDTAKAIFLFLSLLGIKYTIVGKFDPKPESEAE